MIDLASIRNASFTLTPTGYNPEEVDRFLADLADQLAEGLAAAPAPEPVYEAPQTFEAAPASCRSCWAATTRSRSARSAASRPRTAAPAG